MPTLEEIKKTGLEGITDEEKRRRLLEVVTLDSQLHQEAGLDSVDECEFCLAIEEKYDVSLEVCKLPEFSNFREVCTHVLRQLE